MGGRNRAGRTVKEASSGRNLQQKEKITGESNVRVGERSGSKQGNKAAGWRHYKGGITRQRRHRGRTCKMSGYRQRKEAVGRSGVVVISKGESKYDRLKKILVGITNSTYREIRQRVKN